MSSMETAIDEIDSCLGLLSHILEEDNCPVASGNEEEMQMLHWIQQQAATRLSQIEGLKLDLEMGLDPVFIGYASLADLLETIEDIVLEIRALERRAKEIRSRTRMR